MIRTRPAIGRSAPNAARATAGVQNALGRIVALSVAEDGSWTGWDLGPGPYRVTAQEDGVAGLTLENVRAGTPGIVARLVERSTVQVLRVDEAVLEGADVRGNPHCLFLRFAVAEVGSFPHGSGAKRR